MTYVILWSKAPPEVDRIYDIRLFWEARKEKIFLKHKIPAIDGHLCIFRTQNTHCPTPCVLQEYECRKLHNPATVE